MKYKGIFWDIDGTLYDNSGKIPEDEKEILSREKKLETVPIILLILVCAQLTEIFI